MQGKGKHKVTVPKAMLWASFCKPTDVWKSSPITLSFLHLDQQGNKENYMTPFSILSLIQGAKLIKIFKPKKLELVRKYK